MEKYNFRLGAFYIYVSKTDFNDNQQALHAFNFLCKRPVAEEQVLHLVAKEEFSDHFILKWEDEAVGKAVLKALETHGIHSVRMADADAAITLMRERMANKTLNPPSGTQLTRKVLSPGLDYIKLTFKCQVKNERLVEVFLGGFSQVYIIDSDQVEGRTWGIACVDPYWRPSVLFMMGNWKFSNHYISDSNMTPYDALTHITQKYGRGSVSKDAWESAVQLQQQAEDRKRRQEEEARKRRQEEEARKRRQEEEARKRRQEKEEEAARKRRQEKEEEEKEEEAARKRRQEEKGEERSFNDIVVVDNNFHIDLVFEQLSKAPDSVADLLKSVGTDCPSKMAVLATLSDPMKWDMVSARIFDFACWKTVHVSRGGRGWRSV